MSERKKRKREREIKQERQREIKKESKIEKRRQRERRYIISEEENIYFKLLRSKRDKVWEKKKDRKRRQSREKK